MAIAILVNLIQVALGAMRRVTRTGASWRFATYSVLADRVSMPWSFELIRDDHGRAALAHVDVAAARGRIMALTEPKALFALFTCNRPKDFITYTPWEDTSLLRRSSSFSMSRKTAAGS